MSSNYNWIYDLYDSNKKFLGRIGSNKYLRIGEIFIVNESSYEVIRSFYNSHTDYNSDLTVKKIGSVNVTELLYPERSLSRL